MELVAGTIAILAWPAAIVAAALILKPRPSRWDRKWRRGARRTAAALNKSFAELGVPHRAVDPEGQVIR